MNRLTLQAVESGEKVEHKYSGRSPGEEAHGPGQPQQQGEAGGALQALRQPLAAPRRPVRLHVADLDKNHRKNLERAGRG